MEKKYELTDDILTWHGITLYRIKALKSFNDVKIGDLGGWVQSENNLSQEGDCWIYDEAMVYKYAGVYDNAEVRGSSIISDISKVFENALVTDYATLSGFSRIYGNTRIYGNAKISDNAQIGGKANVCGDSIVCDNVLIDDRVHITGNAKIYGNIEIRGTAIIRGDAEIQNIDDFIVFKNWWSSGRYFTWTKSNNMWAVGCFYGTGEELIEKAYKDSTRSGDEYKRIVDYVNNILKNPIVYV